MTRAATDSDAGAKRSGGRRWNSPVVATLLSDRRVSLAFAALGVVQILLALGQVRGVPCPTLHGLGIPCPGCGASRACAALLMGDLAAWQRYHAFAPAFLAGVALLLVAGLLPKPKRDWLVERVSWIERRTALAKLLVVSLVVYWLIRLIYAPAEFIRLLKS